MLFKSTDSGDSQLLNPARMPFLVPRHFEVQPLKWKVAPPAQLPVHDADVLTDAQVPLMVARYAGDAALMTGIATAVQLHQSDADALLAAHLFAAILDRLTVFGGSLQVRKRLHVSFTPW